MKIKADKSSLPVFTALGSPVRLEVIRLLSGSDMNIRQLAEGAGVSSAIMTKHVKKLEEAGIVSCSMESGSAGLQKMCSLAVDFLEIEFPSGSKSEQYKEITIPVGHYSSITAQPTCGLATRTSMIGQFDNPRYFYDPERVNASILWFTTGEVTYTFPNPLLPSQQAISVEISMEICSEAPGYNEDWPSDISFSLNGQNLGMWTSPGDFASTRGRFTPSWWKRNVNQYGLLKIITITEEGAFIDGEKLSDIKLSDAAAGSKTWTLTLSVAESAVHPGGLTIFGRRFGNYDQDIVVKAYYKQAGGRQKPEGV